MSDDFESYTGIKLCRQEDKAQLRMQAWRDFHDVRSDGYEIGITVRRCSESHYRFEHPSGWGVNVYPGNRRIFKDKDAPFLQLPRDWVLRDVLCAIIVSNT
jgi:hypothetical protein